MNAQPLVTVYIPTYNRVKLLKRAVESVRNQTYKNLEIIIVDDCSQDDTALYLEEISKQDPRISYYLKEKNSGACASRNIAIKHAKGEYITGLDDDDVFSENRIRKFIESAIKLDMNKAFLYSSYFFIGKNALLRKLLHLLLNIKQISQEDLLVKNFIGNQIFIKTELLKNTMFDENLKMWQDFDCWYRLTKNHTAHYLPIFSYGLDINHSYQRITDIKKLDETYTYFSEKHLLTKTQKQKLQLQFISYGYYDLNLLDVCKAAYHSRKIVSLLQVGRLVINKLLSKKA